MVDAITGIDGALPQGSMAVIVSRYNETITQNLLGGALQALRAGGVADDAVRVALVPGAWELPLAAAVYAKDPTVVGVVALGAVIRGETTHDQHINRAVSLALMNLGLETGKPIAFGLLTCNTVEQAIHRSGGNVGNKGVEAVDAVLEMLRLLGKIQPPPTPPSSRA